MPAGISVVVENGFATIDFVDKSLRGRGLARLFEIGTPPDAIEKQTRSGPRPLYVVPEGNAREAGLLDEAAQFVIMPADGIEKVGIELPADGTVTEVALIGTGNPAALLPPIENPDGTTPLDPLAPADHEETAVGDPNEDPLPTGDFAPQAWPDGEPESDWTRPELDAYAASKGLDTRELRNKDMVLDAIANHAAEEKNS